MEQVSLTVLAIAAILAIPAMVALRASWMAKSLTRHVIDMVPAGSGKGRAATRSASTEIPGLDEFSTGVPPNPHGLGTVITARPVNEHASRAFEHCWKAAIGHLESQVEGDLNWLKIDLHRPLHHHLSFRYGNQLFFVRIEAAQGGLDVPGRRERLIALAEGCKGHPLLLPMHIKRGVWRAERGGWGLIDARSNKPIDPAALVTDEPIEMTDWELHDFAVQVVRDKLTKSGKRVIAWQGYPDVQPSMWLDGENGPEWVVVRAARYPQLEAEPPYYWVAIVHQYSSYGPGHFASVGVASADDDFDPSAPPHPLWRGKGMIVRFQGLQPAA